MANGYNTSHFTNRLQAPPHFGHKHTNAINPMLYHSSQHSSNSSLQTSSTSISQSMGPFYTKQLEAAQRARMAASPHHHARIAATQSRQILQNSTPTATTLSAPTGSEQNMIPNTQQPADNSSWTSLDMGGMMINHLHSGLFTYSFLTGLYLNHNNLISLPPAIAKLKNLTNLNLTGNKLTVLPVELGLIVSLKELLLFDNQLTFLPPEYGQLYQLELLGLEGNPMSEPINSMINEKGPAVVIKYLRDSCPCILY